MEGNLVLWREAITITIIEEIEKIKAVCIGNDIYQSNSNVNQLLVIELTTGKI